MGNTGHEKKEARFNLKFKPGCGSHRIGYAGGRFREKGLLPVLGLIPFDFQHYSTVADRYAYLAMLGPAIALAWGLTRPMPAMTNQAAATKMTGASRVPARRAASGAALERARGELQELNDAKDKFLSNLGREASASLARIADVHLQLRPGSNVALLQLLLRQIMEDDWLDEAFIAERTEGYADFQTIVADYTPERASLMAGGPFGTSLAFAPPNGAGKQNVLFCLASIAHPCAIDPYAGRTLGAEPDHSPTRTDAPAGSVPPL